MNHGAHYLRRSEVNYCETRVVQNYAATQLSATIANAIFILQRWYNL